MICGPSAGDEDGRGRSAGRGGGLAFAGTVAGNLPPRKSTPPGTGAPLTVALRPGLGPPAPDALRLAALPGGGPGGRATPAGARIFGGIPGGGWCLGDDPAIVASGPGGGGVPALGGGVVGNGVDAGGTLGGGAFVVCFCVGALTCGLGAMAAGGEDALGGGTGRRGTTRAGVATADCEAGDEQLGSRNQRV